MKDYEHPDGHNAVLEEEVERLRADIAELEAQLRATSLPEALTAVEAVHQQKDWPPEANIRECRTGRHR